MRPRRAVYRGVGSVRHRRFLDRDVTIVPENRSGLRRNPIINPSKKTRERDNTPYVDRFVFPESFGVDHDTLVVEEHEAKSVSTKKELAVVKVDGAGGRQVRRIAHAPASVSYRSLLLIGATR